MSSSASLRGFIRPDGRVGSRHHFLVLPSVVCSTLVAGQIARAGGGVSFVHQHGCGHIGDDVEQTEQAFVGVATNPNVAGTLVVSLGCETIQGRRLAEKIGAIGGNSVRFVGIQSSGGFAEAVAAGDVALHELSQAHPELARSAVSPDALMLGIDAAIGDARAIALTDLAVRCGATVVLAADSSLPTGLWANADPIAVGERPTGRLSQVTGTGHGAQRHVGLAAAGAQVIVSFPEPPRAPLGFVTVPVITVSAGGRLHTALQKDFDHGPDTGTDTIWNSVASVFSGSLTTAERLGSLEFFVSRRRRTM
jgi:altronate dehydratase large subunit